MRDLSKYMSRSEVADRLNISQKTVQRLVVRGQLKQYTRPRPGMSDDAAYDPEQVEKLREEYSNTIFEPNARVYPKGQVPKLIEAPKKEKPPLPEVPLHLRLWLRIPEAVAYSGLPLGYIEDLIEDEYLPVLHLSAGRKRVHRKTLEEVADNLANKEYTG